MGEDPEVGEDVLGGNLPVHPWGRWTDWKVSWSFPLAWERYIGAPQSLAYIASPSGPLAPSHLI